MFLVDADSVEDNDQLQLIRRLLAMRGDAPYLGVVAPGSLWIYRIALDRKSLRRARIGSEDWDGARSTVFARLGNVRPRSRDHETGLDFQCRPESAERNRPRRLSTSSRSRTRTSISLVGRALFTRFLAGPEPAAGGHVGAGEVGEPLRHARGRRKRPPTGSTRRSTATRCPCLRAYSRFCRNALTASWETLLRRAPDGQPFLRWEEKWANLYFEHIPVGVLSQAYELHLREHAPAKQKREGGYFTPRPIADLMVRASFRALERRDTGESIRVLDPCCRRRHPSC